MSNAQPSTSDWIDKYKTDYESDEHWNLRRRFMIVHKNKFPEDRLVCLAQVFTNIEFMGCKYPQETMRLVSELSKDVAKEFRESRLTRLKRTFVQASDAAEARAKARTTLKQFGEKSSSRNVYQMKRSGFGKNIKEVGIPATKRSMGIFDGLKFQKFVLYLVGGNNCIRTSAQKCSMKIEEKESFVNGGDKKKIEIMLDEQLVASGIGENLKQSKAKAFQNAVDTLQKYCYSIKINSKADSIKIEKSNNEVVCGVVKQEANSMEEQKLDYNNVGYKMMKMMGWTGGGLGSKTQGREDPVSYLLKNNRAGLGNKASQLDRSYFQKMLRNYINSSDIRDLNFESTFTKDERALLHELAGKLGLKSTSYGKGDDRRLVVTKKNITAEKILTEVLINKTPSFCDKYLVQVPECRSNYYPEFTGKLELHP